ncbi:hypothetical protein [uncultured Kordia sp.]|uniref:hypothetical protein n=1 Tax=uncultured Kordia sp. TaxID=507699 RepID=UPI0026164C12|nr:hypothetical protein [uncultured Kordia sp.]
MRAELETIALIEKYLLNVLSDAETNQFEARMATDPNFKNEVTLQEQLIQGLEHISVQQSIQNAQQTYQFWKLIKGIGLILLPIILALVTWYFVNASAESSIEAETIPTKVEQTIQQNKKVDVVREVVIVPDTIVKKKTPKVTPLKTSLIAANFKNDPLELIPSEIFTISSKKDTIIETQHGIVFLIPENAFVDADQNVVTENITLEIKEAVTSEAIMFAGLGTLHNEKPLETGGMFFLKALKDGEKLQIHPEKEITADIPTQDYKEGMQLFDGETAPDGTIDWVNPKPLNVALIPEDIASLNFYPPAYLETLAEKGYDTSNKKFTDSLYYSFGKMKDTVKTKNYILDRIFKEEKRGKNRRRRRNDIPKDTIRQTYDSVRKTTKTKETLLGLDPLKVKTIWNERYQNTFIATKAFEERLAVIHQNCKEANTIFNLYAQNLNYNLYEVDKMVAATIHNASIREQFNFFAAQNLTNVATLDTDISKLNQYYIAQQQVYRLALEKTQHTMDSILAVDTKYQAFSKQQLDNYYQQELAITTKKVAKELNTNLPRIFNQTPINRSAVSTRNTVTRVRNVEQVSVSKIIKKERKKRRYRAPIRTTGWKNIDRIISEDIIPSLKNRKTVTVKNKSKSTTISYSNYEVTIENSQRFERLFVYLVPAEFNSFIRLEANNDRFTYSVNDLLSYRVHCIGYLNSVPFYFEKTVQNASDKIQLRQITTEKLREKLAKINTEQSSLETEIFYHYHQQENKQTIKKYREIVQLKKEIEAVVFPCQQTKVSTLFTKKAILAEPVEVILADEPDDTTIPFELVEQVPIYPGCETLETKVERKKCMSDKIQKLVNRQTDVSILSKHQKTSGKFKILSSFVIDTSGVVTNIRIRANHPEAAAEIQRVLELIPKMIPAKQKGKNINVKYMLPIIFQVSN